MNADRIIAEFAAYVPLLIAGFMGVLCNIILVPPGTFMRAVAVIITGFSFGIFGAMFTLDVLPFLDSEDVGAGMFFALLYGLCGISFAELAVKTSQRMRDGSSQGFADALSKAFVTIVTKGQSGGPDT